MTIALTLLLMLTTIVVVLLSGRLVVLGSIILCLWRRAVSTATATATSTAISTLATSAAGTGKHAIWRSASKLGRDCTQRRSHRLRKLHDGNLLPVLARFSHRELNAIVLDGSTTTRKLKVGREGGRLTNHHARTRLCAKLHHPRDANVGLLLLTKRGRPQLMYRLLRRGRLALESIALVAAVTCI